MAEEEQEQESFWGSVGSMVRNNFIVSHFFSGGQGPNIQVPTSPDQGEEEPAPQAEETEESGPTSSPTALVKNSPEEEPSSSPTDLLK